MILGAWYFWTAILITDLLLVTKVVTKVRELTTRPGNAREYLTLSNPCSIYSTSQLSESMMIP